MGKKNRKKGGKGRRKGGRDVWMNLNSKDATKRSEAYKTYYGSVQNTCEDFDALWTCMQEPLPTTFRINPTSKFAAKVRRDLDRVWTKRDRILVPGAERNSRDEEGNLTKIFTPAKVAGSLHPVEFIPHKRAYQIDVNKKELKRAPFLKCMKQWMAENFAAGTVTGQELVSMIPPILLQAKSSHYVLDMCAAPGSKSTQIIEDMIVSAGKTRAFDVSGVLVANDVNSKRAYMLASQLQRTPFANVVVTNHAAQNFPDIYDPNTNEKIRYDRVLCDVPCSGDGIARKDKSLFAKWSVNGGNFLHRLQLQIAKRGLALLKVGGLMVYSTCSLNPIENSAVVAELIRNAKGSVEILDVSTILPKMKYAPGHQTWKVMVEQDGNKIFENWNQVPKDNEKLQKGLAKSMFPPSPEEAKKLGLERSMRLLSHHNNTGSFYCCLLRKKRALPKSFHLSVPRDLLKDQVRVEFENVETTTFEPVKKRAKIEKDDDEMKTNSTTTTKATDTNTYFPIDVTLVEFIKEMFGLKMLDKEDAKCFVTRGKNGGCVSYVTKNVAKDFVSNQFDASFRTNGIKVVSAGVRVFDIKNSTEMYKTSETGVRICNPRHARIMQSGLDIFYPLLTRRVCDISIQEMMVLLSNALGKPFDTTGLMSSERIESLKAFPNGCLVFRIHEKDMKEHVLPKFPDVDFVAICGFKGDSTMNIMLTKDTKFTTTQFLKDCYSDDDVLTFPGLEEALKEQDEIEKEAHFTKEEEKKMVEIGDDDDGDNEEAASETTKMDMDEELAVDERVFDRAEIEVTGDGLEDDDGNDEVVEEKEDVEIQEGEYLVM